MLRVLVIVVGDCNRDEAFSRGDVDRLVTSSISFPFRHDLSASTGRAMRARAASVGCLIDVK